MEAMHRTGLESDVVDLTRSVERNLALRDRLGYDDALESQRCLAEAQETMTGLWWAGGPESDEVRRMSALVQEGAHAAQREWETLQQRTREMQQAAYLRKLKMAADDREALSTGRAYIFRESIAESLLPAGLSLPIGGMIGFMHGLSTFETAGMLAPITDAFWSAVGLSVAVGVVTVIIKAASRS